jgi:putative transposase
MPAPDLVCRNFGAEAPDRLWGTDITYVRTEEGFLYLSFVRDAYSRRLVGWAMTTHLRTELVADALQMAIRRRKPQAGLIHHFDQGVQYASLSFGKRSEESGIVPSMGRVGSAYDNALAESFVATLIRPSYCIGTPGLRGSAPGRRSSSTWRAFTTAIGSTQLWATGAR